MKLIIIFSVISLVLSDKYNPKLENDSYGLPIENKGVHFKDYQYTPNYRTDDIVYANVYEGENRLKFKTKSKTQDYEYTVTLPKNTGHYYEGTNYDGPQLIYGVAEKKEDQILPENVIRYKTPSYNYETPSHSSSIHFTAHNNLPKIEEYYETEEQDTHDYNGQIHIPINHQVSVIDDYNQYSHGFALDDGTKVAEQGKLIATGGGPTNYGYVIAKTGIYEYISPDGTPVKVEWVADDKGYRAILS